MASDANRFRVDSGVRVGCDSFRASKSREFKQQLLACQRILFILVNFGPFVVPIPEKIFVNVPPLPFLFLLAVVAFSKHDAASVVAGLKALLLVCLVSQLLRVQIIPDVLVAVSVMAGVQLNCIANRFYAIGCVSIINYLLVLAKREVLMAAGVQFVRTAIIQHHVVIELATGINAFVRESHVLNLKLILVILKRSN